ncbi:hypothetical protein T09_9237, partial [Trichinella sp. T9]
LVFSSREARNKLKIVKISACSAHCKAVTVGLVYQKMYANFIPLLYVGLRDLSFSDCWRTVRSASAMAFSLR